MAGSGFKTFVTGEVLTASDTNGYLMQGVLVFASAVARDAAITAPTEGMYAYLKDTDVTYYYSGSAWVVSGATGDVTGVTAGTGITVTDPTGPVPTVTNSMATAIDAKGDLVAGTGADAFSRLAVGTNNYVLTADSAQATGLKWAAAGVNQSYSLINAGGTALTAASTITVSGISGMNALKILVIDASTVAASSALSFRFNSDSGANYDFAGPQFSTSAAYTISDYSNFSTTAFTRIESGTMSNNAASKIGAYCEMTGCNSTGFKSFTYAGSATLSGGTVGGQTTWGGGIYKGTSTISSVTVFNTAGSNFDGGTIYVYGSA